jgi:hypothetical protein
MVKAIKRRGQDIKAEPETKKKLTKTNIGKLVILTTMALIVIGFTLRVPNISSPQQPQQTNDTQDYGIGTSTGVQQGRVTNLTEHNALFGQLNVALDLSERLEGDLYALDGGVSHLILTNSGPDRIEEEASGSYIVYDIAVCDSFNCLVPEEGRTPNGTLPYNMYQLDSVSEFLTSSQVGIPAY